jgi:hypothetical protein
MPAEATWVWDWLLDEAFPELFGTALLQKVRIILTDQDSKCVSMVEKQILHSSNDN